jgi:hypothetical protein
MKSVDLWALLILSSMPEKPLQLEGGWRSCKKISDIEELEYVAFFHKDELVQDYFGSMFGNGKCGGERIFHFRRTWKLNFNNFNFVTEYKNSGYIFLPKEGAPNWYGCCFAREDVIERLQICDIHEMAGDHDLRLKNEYSYRIKGETLETKLNGETEYLKRIEYPFLFKLKMSFLSFFYSTKTTSDSPNR